MELSVGSIIAISIGLLWLYGVVVLFWASGRRKDPQRDPKWKIEEDYDQFNHVVYEVYLKGRFTGWWFQKSFYNKDDAKAYIFTKTSPDSKSNYNKWGEPID